jgi:hypothetical protein
VAPAPEARTLYGSVAHGFFELVPMTSSRPIVHNLSEGPARPSIQLAYLILTDAILREVPELDLRPNASGGGTVSALVKGEPEEAILEIPRPAFEGLVQALRTMATPPLLETAAGKGVIHATLDGSEYQIEAATLGPPGGPALRLGLNPTSGKGRGLPHN